MNEVHPAETAGNLADGPAQDSVDELAAADSLIEEVSIDGMCGVY